MMRRSDSIQCVKNVIKGNISTAYFCHTSHFFRFFKPKIYEKKNRRDDAFFCCCIVSILNTYPSHSFTESIFAAHKKHSRTRKKSWINQSMNYTLGAVVCRAIFHFRWNSRWMCSLKIPKPYYYVRFSDQCTMSNLSQKPTMFRFTSYSE